MANTAWINLATAQVRIEKTDPELLQRFLGGQSGTGQ